MGNIVDEVRDLLHNVIMNTKGDHYISDCPFCDKESHFYLNIEKLTLQRDGRYVNCFDCKKCGQVGSLYTILNQLDRLDLLPKRYVNTGQQLNSKLDKKEDVEKRINLLPKEVKLPLGFRRVYQDDYLDSRGFTELEYKKYEVGRTKIMPSFFDYVIIAFKEANKYRNYIARSVLSKREIDNINKEYKKKGSKKKYPRYRNCEDSDSSMVVIGLEEIVFTTDTVILVEGFFDKVRVDQALELDFREDMKCCSTLGKNISNEQILKIKKRGVKNIILIQDPDAIDDTREYSYLLSNHFKSVRVGYSQDDIDLGDSSYLQIKKMFDELKNPLEFNLSIVNNKLK